MPSAKPSSHQTALSRKLGLGVVAALFALLPAAFAQFTYTEDFKDATAPGWSFYQGNSGPGPRLTSGSTGVAGADPEGATTIDPSGSGWLRVATATTQQANAVFFDTPIPSAGNEVKITFNVNMWGGNNVNNTGADGLTFFLYDASVPFSVGAFGGSLGYAQKDTAQGADTTHDGMSGGYLGVALDAYGNYSRAAEGRDGGTSALAPNAVVVRGPGSGQTGYDYLAGTTGSNGTQGRDYTDTGGATTNDTNDGVLAALPYTMAFKDATARPEQSTQYRKVEFTLTETSQLIIRMQFGEDGLWYNVLDADVSSFARPDQLRFGFSAGTGTGTQVYEVGGLLQITATAGSGSFIWDHGDGTTAWGTGATDPINWYGNTNPTSKSNVVFNSAYVSGAQTVDLQDTDKAVKNLYFSGQNAYTLITTEGHKLVFDSDTVGGLTTMSLTSDVNGNAAHTVAVDLLLNKTLDINNTISTHTFTLSGNVDTNGNTINFKGTGTTQLTGVVSGAGTLTKADTGTTILSGASANTYTGTTTVNGGVLQIEKAAALGATAAGTTVNSGGTLALAGTGTTYAAEGLSLAGSGAAGQGALYNAAGNNTWTGTVTLADDASVGTATGTTLTVSGVVAGAAGNDLTKTGTGTLVLTGPNTYAGATNINAGTVRISADANLGAAPGAATADQLTLNTGTLETTANLTLNANRGITLNSGGGTFDTNAGTTLTYNGVIAGTGALAKTDTGTLSLGGNNTYTGATNINAGTLTLATSNALADATVVTVASGATFNVNSQTDTIAALNGTGATTLGSGTLTVGSGNASSVYGGVASGTGGIIKTGSGDLTLNGASTSTYTGTTRIDAGTVTLAASNQLADTSTLTFNGGTLAVGASLTDTIGSLTLMANSGLDFNNATSTLTFTNATRSGGVLTIYDWAGDMSGGGASRLVFTNAQTGFNTASDIVFDGYDAGFTRLASGEIVPLTGTVYEWNVNAAGNWTTDSNWTPDPTGLGVGPDGAGVTVIFGSSISASRTVTASGTKTVGYMVFNDDNNYTITGGTIALDVNSGFAQMNVSNTGSHTISSALTLTDSVKMNQNSSGVFLISGAIGGAGTLIKNGTGVLTLSNTGSTYTGGTTVNAGTLRVSADRNLGATSGAVTLNGGTLEATASFTLNANRSLTIGAAGGTLDVDSTRTLTYNGVLAGSGTLTKADAGTLVLGGTAANTHTGNITITAGTLQIAKTSTGVDALPASTSQGGIGDQAAVTLTGGSLVFNGDASQTLEEIGSLAGDVGTTVNNQQATALTLYTGQNNASTLFAGTLTDSGGNLSLVKQGTGTMILSGANTYDGATTVSGGVLNVQSAGGLGNTTNGTTVNSGASLELQSATGIAIGAEALTLSGTGIFDNGALRSIAGTNSYAGNITLNADAEIQTDAGSLTLSGAINGNAASRTLTFDGAGNTTASGVIGNNVSTVTKAGSGTLTLSGTNTYTGATNVNAGTVVVSNASGLGTTGAGTTVTNGATLALTNGGSMTVAENLTLKGQGVASAGALQNLAGTNTVSGTIALTGETYVGVNSGSQLTGSGVISGGYGLTKVGDGTLVLSGANTYTGTTAVNAGTLVAQNATALGTNANPTTVANGATLALSGSFTTTEAVTLSGTGVGGAGALQGISGATTISGDLNMIANTSVGVSAGAALTAGGVISGTGYGLTKVGDGTLTLSGASTYTGGTTVRAGTLTLAADVPVSGNGALGHASSVIQVGDAGTGSTTVSLLAGGTGGVEIERAVAVNNYGTGTTLGGSNGAGTNTFSGAITLNKNVTLTAASGGTVEFAGAIGGTGAVTTSGAGNITLSGSNTFTGATTIGGTGVVTLSGTGGALAATSGLTLSSGSTTLLGASNQINDAASLTLSGGTLRLNGYQDVMTNVSLTASTTSVFDYVNDNSQLRFTGTATVGASSQLTIDNWAGDAINGSSGYGLLFNTQAQALALENNVLFNGWTTLGNNAVIANGSYWEIVPLITVREWGAAGSGNWDTNGNWSGGAQPDSAGANAKFGNNITAGTTAVINTANVTDTETVGNMIFDTTGARNYTISGTDNVVFNTGGTAASQLIVNGDGQHTINSAITATSRLVITNDGTATSAPPLTINGAIALPNATGDDLTVGGTGRTALAGVISGASSSLLKTGSGTLVLSAANTYTGDTTLRNGTIEVAGNAPSGSAGNLGNSANAVIINDANTNANYNTALLMTDANGGSTVARNITVNNFGATTTLGGTNTSGTNTFSGNISFDKDVTLTAASGGTVAFTGALSGAGGLVKSGTGTVTLGGTTQNTFSGDVTVSAGTLQIAKTTAGGVDALPASTNQGAIGDQSAVVVANGASLVFNGDTNQVLEEIGSLAGGATASVNNLQATALTLYTGQNNTTTTYAGTLTDSGGNLSLVKQGTGTMTLAGANSYDGATTVNAGTLVIANNTALGNTSGDTSVAAGATLALQQDIAVGAGEAITLNTSAAATTASLRNDSGANSIAGDIALSGAATQGVQIETTTGTLTLSGAITQTSTSYVNKTGGGTLALAGTTANTFSGTFSVNDGTVTLNKSGAGANTATGSGALNIGDGIGLAHTAIVSLSQGNQINDTAAVTLASDGRLALNGNTETVGSIAGSGEILLGTGQLIAGGTNASTTFSGTLAGASASILSKTGTGTLTIGSNVNAAPGDFAGTLNLSGGTLALNVDNAFTGTVNVSAGTTLKLSDANVSIASLNFTGTGTITLDFSGVSTLNVSTLFIAAGVTLNVVNWTDASDYFFAQSWTGATQNVTGLTPMNQVVFATFNGSDTKWQSYDKQITPVPEPSTYGALLLGSLAGLMAYRRWRQAKSGRAA